MKKNSIKFLCFILLLGLISFTPNSTKAYAYTPIYLENNFSETYIDQCHSLHLQTREEEDRPVTAHIYLDNAVFNETIRDENSEDSSFYIENNSKTALAVFFHLKGSNRLVSYSGQSPIVVDSIYGGAVYLMFTVDDNEQEADIGFCSNEATPKTIDFIGTDSGSANYHYGSFFYKSYYENNQASEAYMFEPERIANENNEITYTLKNHNIHAEYERTTSHDTYDCYCEKAITTCSEPYCGRKILTDFFNDEHHDWMREDSDEYPEDCTQSITVRSTCVRCQKVKEEVEFGPHRFNYGEMPDITDCTREYEKVNTCEICGYEDRATIPAREHHDFAEIVSYISQPTCGNPGEALYRCANCTTESVLEIQPTGQHNWVFDKTILEPTCSSSGKDLYVCSDCGTTEERMTDATPGSNHNWVFNEGQSVVATCIEDGYKLYVCADCDETYRETIPASSEYHEWSDWELIDEPACDKEGEEQRMCMNCQETETRTVDTTEHNWQFVNENPVATCSSKGVANYICADCGATKKEETDPVTDAHIWSEWEITKEATCIEEGTLCEKCTVCGEKRTTSIPSLGHDYQRVTSGTPTCITPSVTKVVCTRCGNESLDYPSEEEYDDTNHEGSLQLIVDIAATTEKEGLGHKVWSCCGLVTEEAVVIPQLTADNSKEVISDIIGIDTNPDTPDSEKTPVEKAVESIKKETLLTVAEEVNEKFEEIANLSGVSQETKQTYIETVIAATEGAVIAGSKLDNVEEETEKITEKLPSNFSINLGDKLAQFYQNQFDYILGNTVDPSKNISSGAVNKAQSNANGIDYTEGANLYKQVGEFIDNSVEHMTQAASLVRECSNEKVTAAVNDYIDIVSVKSFRSFDKQAADLEFADNAYKAILAHMQEQTIANLNASFEEMSASLSGVALDNLKEEYEAQLAICENVEDFETFIIEVMRQKCNSVLNEKYSNNVISYEEYMALYVGETDEDFENFRVTYKNIFYCWALGDSAEEYGFANTYNITLQELTDAAISNTSLQKKKAEINKGLTTSEIVAVSVLGGASILSICGLALVNILKKRKEIVK